MQHDLIIQSPAAPTQLLLLAHGLGTSANDLAPLGQALAPLLPSTLVVSLQAPTRADAGDGWQWFSVLGVSDANRRQRVAAALPGFVQAVQHWQRETGLGAAATTLLGFSQGAIMSLAATQLDELLAARVLAVAGRFAEAPRRAPPGLQLHLLHGDQDAVMPVTLATEAAAQWRALAGQATLDRFPGLGHGIDARMLRRMAELLDREMR